MTTNPLRVIARNPFALIIAITLYMIALYCLCYAPEHRQWKHSESQLKEAQQRSKHQQNDWQRCQHPLNKNTQHDLWSYLNHQMQSPSAAKQAEHLLQYFDTHNLSIEHYSAAESAPNSHQQRVLFKVCGQYPDIKRALLNWTQPTFLAWIETLSIQPCPEKHSQLQLTLLLENTHD